MTPDVGRVVALGASNLTRGFHTVVSAARAAWGPNVEILAALGHGRSYGVASRMVIRTLPGILESGLWKALESRPAAITRALVTDVGNDILYGFSPEQTLAWVEETLDRLRRCTSDIVLTGLPLASVRRLSRARFLAFRSVLVPSCRLTLAQVVDAAERVNDGLGRLAAESGAELFPLDPSWYGFDPIHIRPSLWSDAWLGILGGDSRTPGRGSLREGLGLYFMRPERCRLLGVELHSPQAGVALPAGGRVWLY